MTSNTTMSLFDGIFTQASTASSAFWPAAISSSTSSSSATPGYGPQAAAAPGSGSGASAPGPSLTASGLPHGGARYRNHVHRHVNWSPHHHDTSFVVASMMKKWYRKIPSFRAAMQFLKKGKKFTLTSAITLKRLLYSILCKGGGEYVNCHLNKWGDRVEWCDGYCGIAGVWWKKSE